MSWNDGNTGPFGRNNNDPRPEGEPESFARTESVDAAASSSQSEMPALPPLPALGEYADDGQPQGGAAPATGATDAPAEPANGGWSSFAPPAYGESAAAENDTGPGTGTEVGDSEPAPVDETAGDTTAEHSFAAALGESGDANAAREEPDVDTNATQAYPTEAFHAAGETAPTTPYDREAMNDVANSSRDAQPTEAYGRQTFQAEAPATQSFGAPPAAFPGDSGNAVGSGYDAAVPAPGQGGGGTQSPTGKDKAKKPWFRRRGFIITAIVAAVLIIAAAVGIPWYIHTQNVQRGDDLAADFQSQLNDYNSTWNADNLAAVTSPSISSVLSSSSQTFFDLTSDGVDQLTAACSDISGAQETRQQLADAKVPELPADDGAEASEAYRQAQADADALASSREAADAFLSESEAYLAAQQQLCDTIPAYAELQQNYRDDQNTTMPDAYVIENGGEITTNDGAIYFPCSNASGCPDLYNDDTREQFASAYESTYVDYYAGLAEQYGSNCFLDAFQSVCDVAAEQYRNAADANQAVVDHLRNTEPTVEVGQTLYPDLDGLIQDAQTAENDAASAVLTEWQSIEPNVGSSLTRTGTSIATYLDGLKSQADQTASSIAG